MAVSRPSEARSRRDENRIQWIAALTLAFVMAGHALLETASDSLFLANVAVERLPFLTIAIALLALAASRGRWSHSHRRALTALLSLAALGTLTLWTLVLAAQDWTFYALYIWSGFITSLIVVRFWLLLGDLFTITEGKRLYAAIGMGGSVGALLGSGAAAALAPYVGGEGLLIAASLAFGVSTFGPGYALDQKSAPPQRRADDDVADGSALSVSLRCVLDNPYACRVAGLVMMGGITLTLGDYLFKSVVAEEIAAEQIASSISRIYLGLNVLSISMLAFGVTPLLRRLGVDRSMAVLPALVGLGGIGVLAGGALAATIFIKAADGTLRYSLHKTASELLYLPMSSRLRSSVKGAIDIVGHTGAKALASVLILGLALSTESRMLVAAAVVASAAIWFVSALMLRHSYLNVFRQTLREGTIETVIDHPELDLDSAGSLLRALSDSDERRVVAAMRILVERGRASLIPSLILYHPSPLVVATALDMFATIQRDDLEGLLKHLIDHEDANVRAATVRATWMIEHDVEHLRTFRESECLVVRVSAMAGLLSAGDAPPEEYRLVLDEAAEYESFEPRLAAAAAARLSYHEVYREALLAFAADEDSDVAREAVRAIHASGDDWYTRPLVGLLGDRRIRDGVRRALLDRGRGALHVLAECLVDPETPIPVLRHIPRTIALFELPEAAEVLIESFARVESGMVRFKLLRGLETLLIGRGQVEGIDSALASQVDTGGIRVEFDRSLQRSLDLLHFEAELTRVQAEEPNLANVSGELLLELLQDKRELAAGRLFMMLGLIYPKEDFRRIRTGLQSEDPTDRASAEELVDSLLSRDVGRAVLGLVMPGTVDEQLATADPIRKGRHLAVAEVVRELLRDDSRSLRAVALYYAGDIGIEDAPEDLPGWESQGGALTGEESTRLQDRALSILRDLSEKPTSRPIKPMLAR